MKLVKIQTILGTLIVLFYLYIFACMIFIIPADFDIDLWNNTPLPINVALPLFVDHPLVLNAARYTIIVAIALGLLIIYSGIRPVTGRMVYIIKNPIVMQIIAGICIAILSIFIFRYGFPLLFVVISEDGTLTDVPPPSLFFTIAKIFSFFTIILGMAVAYFGVVQYNKMRKNKLIAKKNPSKVR